MSVKINAILAETVPPGIYALSSRAWATTIVQAIERHGWRCFYLDGRQIEDKAAFLAASAQAMRFPSYFGHNWDALDECLTDLSWAPASGYVLLYDDAARFEAAHPTEWATARAILADAVAHWRALGTPMYVLLRRGE
jgi:Barstar (barnase inhibitor)